jgi:hypothetical protein
MKMNTRRNKSTKSIKKPVVVKWVRSKETGRLTKVFVNDEIIKNEPKVIEKTINQINPKALEAFTSTSTSISKRIQPKLARLPLFKPTITQNSQIKIKLYRYIKIFKYTHSYGFTKSEYFNKLIKKFNKCVGEFDNFVDSIPFNLVSNDQIISDMISYVNDLIINAENKLTN